MESYHWLWFVSVIALYILFNVVKGYRSPKVLAKMTESLRQGGILIDVRTSQEFETGHHPSAVNIPLRVLSSASNRIGPKETPVVVYCRSGSRSSVARRMLIHEGFSEVMDLGPYRNIRSIPAIEVASQRQEISSSKKRTRSGKRS